MYAFLGILSVIGFLVCVILLIIAKVKKNGKVKKWAIGAGTCFVVFVIALILAPGLTPEQIAQHNQAKELKVKQAAEIVEKTKADAIVADAKAAVDAEAKAKQDAADKVIADAKAIEDKKIADAAAAPMVVTTDKLLTELDSNALNASNAYKGKYVELTGELSNIDSSGKYFSLDPINNVNRSLFTSVMCYITEEQKNTVANFKKKQQVTVIGTITGVGEVMGYSLKVETIK